MFLSYSRVSCCNEPLNVDSLEVSALTVRKLVEEEHNGELLNIISLCQKYIREFSLCKMADISLPVGLMVM